MSPDPLQRWRDAARSVNRPPGQDWRDAVVHHGFRAVLVLAMAVVVPLLFPRTTLPEFEEVEEGRVAPRDVIAQVPFTVYKSEEQLAGERREAEAGVASIFAFRPEAADSAVSRVRLFFAELDDAASAEAPPERLVAGADTAGIRETLEDIGVPSPPSGQVVWLAEASNRLALRRGLESAFRALLPSGVAPGADLSEVRGQNVIVRRDDRDRLVAVDSIITVGTFYQEAVRRAPDLAAAGRQLYQTLLVRFIEPSLRLDRDATQQARDQARSAVEASAGFVLEGERIVAAHERVGKTEIEKLRAYEAKLVEEGLVGGPATFWRDLGGTLYALFFLGLVAGLLFLFRPDVYRDLRSFVLVVGLLFGVVAFAGISAQIVAQAAAVGVVLVLAVPVAVAALLIGALFDGVLAVVVVLSAAGLMAGQPGFATLPVLLFTLAGGGTAALAIREVRRRSQSWILIAVITGGYVLAGLVLFLMAEMGALDLFRVAVAGAANATFSTALAMGAFLPLLESFTKRTSDQTLLELADLNRPLLQRLSREAPGTYAHSIGVANLAEPACLAIGANALLTRVGSYYHDIGKMLRPQYFIENQPKGINPHDRLRPSQSAEVIRDHVREGLKLAEEAKLPPVIKDFIREHHGTQKIAYFFAKAQEEEPELELNPADFCYPGPKPQSKETAVVMLADGVESACRTLADPSPERIRALVDQLVQARIDEDQLDQSPLTLRDVDQVKSYFARVLTGLYHRRIDYPAPTVRPQSRTAGEADGGRPEPAEPAAAGADTPVGPLASGGARPETATPRSEASGSERRATATHADGSPTGPIPREQELAREPTRPREQPDEPAAGDETEAEALTGEHPTAG